MRSRVILLGLILAGAAPALAQEAGSAKGAPSVEGYLCTFAGKCSGADAPSGTRDAPETKGFRLARPTGPAAGEASNVSLRSAAPRAASRAGYVASGAGGRRGGAVSGYAGTRVSAAAVAGAQPRADLMIGFALNSAQLSADGRSSAQIFARSLLMPELQSKRFLIEGHTDLRGGRALNNSLSAQRAQAVADYLKSLGVGGDRLQIRGFGSSRPLPGHRVTDPANRRVEAVLLS